jgi:recombinational DNA repair protein RecT
VYEKDVFEVEEGIEPRIIHKHGLSDRGEKIGAYCVWKLKNGETQFEIMSKEEILSIRNRSSSKTKEGVVVGPWKTDEAEMWRKTVVRRASKYMPLSTEAQRAVMADNQAEGIIEADDYSGNEMDITDFNDVPAAEAQVQTLEEKIVAKAKPAPKTPLHIDILEAGDDDEGMTDWDGWAISACEIVASLSEEEREAWRVLHEGMLEEAELMAPRSATKLMKFFK